MTTPTLPQPDAVSTARVHGPSADTPGLGQSGPGPDALPAPPRSRGPWSRALSVAMSIVVAGMLALAVAVVVAPKALGAVPLTVLSGSMEPGLSPGDVVVVRPVAAEDVRVGDVVTFQPVSDDPSLVTHRVVGVGMSGAGESTFTTRGDANGADDEPIVADQVMGRVAYSVPLVGHVTNASWGPTAVTVAAAALITYALLVLVVPERTRSTRTPAPTERGASDA
jgi:signal peptidase I